MRRLAVVLIVVIIMAMAGIRVGVAGNDLFDTKSAAEHSKKGIELLKAKNYKAAIDELEEAVSIAPDAESYYYLGYAYYFEGRTGDKESRKKSMESFEEAYELNPNFTPGSFKSAETGEAAQGESGHPDASAATDPSADQSDAQSPQPSD